MEDLTADNIALSILVLKGEHGKDWEYQSDMTNDQWWQVIFWIRRN